MFAFRSSELGLVVVLAVVELHQWRVVAAHLALAVRLATLRSVHQTSQAQ